MDEDEEADTAWGECWGVRMSPANPYYVGTDDNICGGEVVYTIPEIKDLLRGHSEDAQRWLTTSQMGWALTRERNELTNERDERDGKPVARQLAPMISKFIREQCEMQDFENMENDRRQILEEAAELDHILGVWEAETEPISDAAG